MENVTVKLALFHYRVIFFWYSLPLFLFDVESFITFFSEREAAKGTIISSGCSNIRNILQNAERIKFRYFFLNYLGKQRLALY